MVEDDDDDVARCYVMDDDVIHNWGVLNDDVAWTCSPPPPDPECHVIDC